MLIAFGIRLLANAVGLLVAAWILPDLTVSGAAFVIAVVIFTVVEAIADPFITKIALSHAPALRGSVALLATFVGLVITAWLSDGLDISGASTWLFATLIVWLASLVAGLLLPLILVKKAVRERNS